TRAVSMPAKLEMDIAQLPEDEAQVFLAEYGIEEPGLNRFIRLSYDLLGLQSFFTAGDKETHAWTVARGALAPEAAGVIHSDMQKGFIRAEVVSYDDLINLGSFAEARNQGRLRVEGKKYVMQDGDVIEIRFNI
ncbi:MAG: redox-regulated ATPase YchF, partial [Anaerolineaceae bacterium]|nr:redox-regulated ATPase YchF [Anaerolineaceae bacterium]